MGFLGHLYDCARPIIRERAVRLQVPRYSCLRCLDIFPMRRVSTRQTFPQATSEVGNVRLATTPTHPQFLMLRTSTPPQSLHPPSVLISRQPNTIYHHTRHLSCTSTSARARYWAVRHIVLCLLFFLLPLPSRSPLSLLIRLEADHDWGRPSGISPRNSGWIGRGGPESRENDCRDVLSTHLDGLPAGGNEGSGSATDIARTLPPPRYVCGLTKSVSGIVIWCGRRDTFLRGSPIHGMVVPSSSRAPGISEPCSQRSHALRPIAYTSASLPASNGRVD
jgi:hypothetical protein